MHPAHRDPVGQPDDPLTDPRLVRLAAPEEGAPPALDHGTSCRARNFVDRLRVEWFRGLEPVDGELPGTRLRSGRGHAAVPSVIEPVGTEHPRIGWHGAVGTEIRPGHRRPGPGTSPARTGGPAPTSGGRHRSAAAAARAAAATRPGTTPMPRVEDLGQRGAVRRPVVEEHHPWRQRHRAGRPRHHPRRARAATRGTGAGP